MPGKDSISILVEIIISIFVAVGFTIMNFDHNDKR